MPLRSFRSADGAEWLVWSVVPGPRHDPERRRGYDRRSPDPVLRYSGPERRTAPDRRATRLLVKPELQAGWLVFESPRERRRLSPVPPAWERYTDAALERMCARAEPCQPGPADTASRDPGA